MIDGIFEKIRGRGAVGSTFDWQSKGHGFKSRRLHFLFELIIRDLIIVMAFVVRNQRSLFV